jgi:hypothetical protein
MPVATRAFFPTGTWRGYLSKIVWGPDGDEKTILIAFPLEDVRPHAVPRDGHEVVDGRDHARDGWATGWDQRLSFTVRHIPATTETVSGMTATGWWEPGGWDDFLTTWAWDLYPFRLHPEAAGGTFFSCYLLEPRRGAPEPGWNFAYRPRFTVATTDGVPFSGW